MKYIDEFRDGALARAIAARIKQDVQGERIYRLMEFCGGHTHAISRYGLEDLLPPNVQLIHGPGCPVCVLPMGRVDLAIRCAQMENVTLCVYGDLMRVPGSNTSSLLKAKARGADVRMVYSTLDVLRLAEAEPQREFVFFAIGFETTTPPTTQLLALAIKKKLTNLSIISNHVLTPPAMRAILGPPDCEPIEVEGFIGPAHVSTIIGTKPYETFARDDGKPVVVAGFEPLDVLQAILMLIHQLNEGRATVENQYIRAVTQEGNVIAQAQMDQYFELRESFEWRGLGRLPNSARRLKPQYAHFDAEERFGLAEMAAQDNPACECGTILRGVKKPRDCKLFGTVCTPDTPMGSCMVSAEGACAAYWTYGRFREAQSAATKRSAA